MWCGSAKVIVERERKSFFNGDAARADRAGGKSGSDELCGTFVFLPNMNIEGKAKGFTHAGFFKGGADENGIARTREDESEEPFAETPANASEVIERRAGADDDGVKVGLHFRHAMLGAEQTIAEIVRSERANAIAEGFEVGEVGRELRG